MPRCIKDYLIVLSAGLCLSTAVFAAQTEPQHFTLLSRVGSLQLDTQLDKAQRQWLQNKRELVLGAAAPGPLTVTLTRVFCTRDTLKLAPFALTATGGGSNQTITYVSSNTNVATIVGNTVTIVGAGSTTITASQAGDVSLPGTHPIYNFMDYTDDSCMNTFSDEQSIRMQDITTAFRPTLGN